MAQLRIPVEQALALPTEELGALLEPGLEYTGTVYRKVPFRGRDGGSKENRYVRVVGTLPTLAAAMDKPELLRFLLRRGHDVNSASQTAVEALLDDLSLHDEFSMVAPHFSYPGTHSASGHSSITVDTPQHLRERSPFEAPLFQCSGITPLAAAIVCGSVACVRVLLEQSGIWTTECPAVSLALALDCRKDDATYAEACRLARALPDGSLRPLTLRCIICSCSADFLRDELAAAEYDTAAIQDAADELFSAWRLGNLRGSPLSARKFALLASHDPDAFQTPVLLGRLASAFLCRQGNAQLLELVERFCRDRDINLGYDQAPLFFLPLAELKAGLERLCAIGRPVLSCDAVLTMGRSFKDDAKLLRLLLEHVHLLPGSHAVGLSALTCAVLKTGSLPLLELALKKGAIPAREPLGAMLELTQSRPALRARLLTEKRPDSPLSPLDWTQTLHCSFPEEYIRGVLDADAPSELCHAALLSGLFLLMSNDQRPLLPTPLGEVDVIDPVLFFSMQGKTEPLRAFLSARPQRYGAARVSLPEQKGKPRVDGRMILTPLCAAALTGQTETVEMLLALGYDANEHDAGSPSLLHVTSKAGAPPGPNNLDAEYREVPLSPLFCALLSGSGETAELLRAHGAVWDMDTAGANYAIEVLRA